MQKLIGILYKFVIFKTLLKIHILIFVKFNGIRNYKSAKINCQNTMVTYSVRRMVIIQLNS